MERIFEVADLLKRIENEIYEDRTIKVTTLTIVEEPTGNTLSVNSKLDVDNFIDMIYYFHKFFDI